jgi:hypothetical protein
MPCNFAGLLLELSVKTLSEINKAIAGIAKSGAKLDKTIQDTGVAVLQHFAEHKDTGLVNRLFLALPKGARKAALAAWLIKFCAVVPNTDAKTKGEQPFVYAKDKATDPVGGAQSPWYEYKPEKPVDQMFDLQVAVRSLMTKMVKAAKVEHSNDEALKALKSLAVATGIPESDVPTMTAYPVNHPAATF